MFNKLHKYKSDFIFWGLIIGTIILTFILFEVLLPFFIGLILTFFFNPLIKKTQKVIPNRNFATTLILFSTCVVIVGTVWIFSTQISNDFKKLNNAVQSYAQGNSKKINATTGQIQSYIATIYSPEDLRKALPQKLDSTNFNDSDSTNKALSTIIDDINIDQLKETWATISALFPTQKQQNGFSHNKNINWFVVFFSAIGYFLYIVYTFEYFQGSINKYFHSGFEDTRIFQVLNDVQKIFCKYFRQRSIIVFAMFILYTLTFNLLGLPGAILLGLIASLLCYIAYFQYITLLLVAISCLLLSLESSVNFFLLFGISTAIFIVGSLIEEFVLIPKYMKDVAKMNPAIITVSLAIWSYLLGTFGLLIALPMTFVIQSYLKQVLLIVQKNQTSAD